MLGIGDFSLLHVDEDVVEQVISNGFFVSRDIVEKCCRIYSDYDAIKKISILFAFNMIDEDRYRPSGNIEAVRRMGMFYTHFKLVGDGGWLINLKPGQYSKFYEEIDVLITHVEQRR